MFTQRSSVVLPEPLGTMITTVSPRATVSDTPRRTSCIPKRLTMPDMASIGRFTAAASVAGEDASFKMLPIQRECVADAKVDRRRGDEDLEGRERALHHLAARQRQFPQPNDRNQRRRLHQVDAQVDERRC